MIDRHNETTDGADDASINSRFESLIREGWLQDTAGFRESARRLDAAETGVEPEDTIEARTTDDYLIEEGWLPRTPGFIKAAAKLKEVGVTGKPISTPSPILAFPEASASAEFAGQTEQAASEHEPVVSNALAEWARLEARTVPTNEDERIEHEQAIEFQMRIVDEALVHKYGDDYDEDGGEGEAELKRINELRQSLTEQYKKEALANPVTDAKAELEAMKDRAVLYRTWTQHGNQRPKEEAEQYIVDAANKLKIIRSSLGGEPTPPELLKAEREFDNTVNRRISNLLNDEEMFDIFNAQREQAGMLPGEYVNHLGYSRWDRANKKWVGWRSRASEFAHAKVDVGRKWYENNKRRAKIVGAVGILSVLGAVNFGVFPGSGKSSEDSSARAAERPAATASDPGYLASAEITPAVHSSPEVGSDPETYRFLVKAGPFMLNLIKKHPELKNNPVEVGDQVAAAIRMADAIARQHPER